MSIRDVMDEQCDAERFCGVPLPFKRRIFVQRARIPQDRDVGNLRGRFFQQFKALAGKFGAGIVGEPRHIATGPGKARDKFPKVRPLPP